MARICTLLQRRRLPPVKLQCVDWFNYRAKAAKIDHDPSEAPPLPEIKIDELEARPEPIEVVESTLSDTFIGRIRADLRALLGGK
jgi:hypothetical protein